MNLTDEYKAVGKENFFAAVGNKLVRRDFLQAGIKKGIRSKRGLGSYYFGYGTVDKPLRVGILGTGDEGSVLIGALNPEYVTVASIADIRPYNIHRAFHGHYRENDGKVELISARPGLMNVYGWKTEREARGQVKVYEGPNGDYRQLIENAARDGIEAVIIALPLHLHAPAAIAAMNADLHVLTEKLMGHSVCECKEMAQVAQDTGLHLATGHQRHYNILYDNAVNLIREGVLGDLHYIRAQWHRGNLPHNDSWKMPLPPGIKTLQEDPEAEYLLKQLGKWEKQLAAAEKENDPKQCEQCHWMIDQLKAQIEDRVVQAHEFDYQDAQWPMADGTTYRRPALEELIRWRLWDRTGGGLMAELGSHQLDAASIFISAMHGGKKQYPLSVVAAANRPIFPADRDVEDHVYCLFEFPAPGYDPNDEYKKQKKIGVAYASINGNGWGGYGETVFGTDGTLILDREAETLLYRKSDVNEKTRIKKGKTGGVELETVDDGDPVSAALGLQALDVAGRGYTEEIEHWAWCIRNPDPENQPKCHPKVALADAVIALTTNLAAREGKRVEFKKEWFDPYDDATPEGNKPDLSRYT